MPGPGATVRPEEDSPGERAPDAVAEVATAAPTAGGDGLYDYLIPLELSGLVRAGVRLLVPLAGRTVEGFCIRTKPGSDLPASRLKSVLSVVDQRATYPESSLDLAVWTARRYLCQPGEVLRAAIPAQGRARGPAGPKLKLAVDRAAALDEATRLKTRAPLQAAVLRELEARGPAGVAALSKRLGRPAGEAVRSLAARGLIAEAATRRRAPRKLVAEAGLPASDPGEPGAPRRQFSLNSAQQAALRAITDSLGRPTGQSFLLHGVTGSGKTEVYLRAAAEVLAAGRQVLLLVPEVSLVPQTLERVRSHLGGSRVAVAHSYLGGSERLDYWEKVAAGRADVVVGARSAIFAPLGRLGLIVLDEEHEDSYKQEEGAPRYHAREVAARRSSREGAALILSSATPSLESYQRALAGEHALLPLPQRAGGRPMPPVEVVDLRAELASGNRGLFSRALQQALSEAFAAGKQAILFLNRRGHSTFVLCRDCGWVARCPRCDVSLTYHDPEQDLQCHYCGHHRGPPEVCPNCGGHRVRYFGAGTQRVEDEVHLYYPAARVARLDADVVRRPGEASRVLALFEAGQADVLVGTQMVAKGLDIPGVAVVAAVAADSALHLPDFRAPEKTFRVLTQAAGRAGRGDTPGRVLIQTYNPGHPAVTAAARHDYGSFAAAELESRRALGYPPWTHLVRVEFADPDDAAASAAAAAFAGTLGRLGVGGGPGGGGAPASAVETTAGLRYAGPAPAPLARLRGRFRWHVLVFGPDLEQALGAIRETVRQTTGREARGGRRKAPGGPAASVDVDPVSVL